MSRHATAYVRGLEIADETARTVFLLLAERTTAQGDRHRPEEIPQVMGLELQDTDIAALAVLTGIAPEDFRQQLRELKKHVSMSSSTRAASGKSSTARRTPGLRRHGLLNRT